MAAYGVGGQLRRAREARGLSLDEVSDGTRVRRRYLEALEAERLDEIPGPAYVRGFLRAYAAHLGLDGDALVEDLVAAYPALRGAARPTGDAVEIRITPTASRSRFRRILTAALLAAAAAGVFVAYTAYRQVREFQTSAPGVSPAPVAPSAEAPASTPAGPSVSSESSGASSPAPAPGPADASATPRAVGTGVPQAAPAVPVPVPGPGSALPPGSLSSSPPSKEGPPTPAPAVQGSSASANAANTGAAPSAPAPASLLAAARERGQAFKPVRVSVAAGERAWIRVVVDGAAVYDGTLGPGDHMVWQGRHEVILSAANGAAFDVTVNGRPAGRLGAANEVVEQTFTAQPAGAAP